MKYLFPPLFFLFFFAGCAKSPYQVNPSHVSPATYEGYTCEELSKETNKIYPDYQRVCRELQEELDDNEIMWKYLEFSIFPPRSPKNNDKYDELADLKGHLYAIKDKSDELNCGILIVLPVRKK